MDFSVFEKGCKAATDRDSILRLYKDMQQSSKEDYIKKSKTFSLTIGMVENVEIVPGKQKPDGTMSDPKTVFTLINGTRLHYSGRTDSAFENKKHKQVFFMTNTSSFGNNNIYIRIEKILAPDELLKLLGVRTGGSV